MLFIIFVMRMDKLWKTIFKLMNEETRLEIIKKSIKVNAEIIVNMVYRHVH